MVIEKSADTFGSREKPWRISLPGDVILVNMNDTDLELLVSYARHRAEDAFAEIVRRHLDLVHSAALRQVRSPQLAEEVAQSTFLKLAQHARQLAPGTIVSAWLYQVTRRTAIDVVRHEASRQLREQIATEMNAMNATAADWTHIKPLLDEAMHALDETDRAAVLLRYFENKSLREVGQTLGASENAAQKRLTRAVERLREFFAKRGVSVGASGLVVVISANAVQAAPVGLAVTISTAAALSETAIVTTASTSATKVIAMTTTQKALIATTLTAVLGVGIYETRQASIARGKVQTLRQHEAQITTELDRMTSERDDAMRQLAASRSDNERFRAATGELLKLRGEVARLKTEAQEMALLRTGNTNDQTLSEAVVWKKRVDQLREYLESTPAAKIPELQFVTEQDWLDAARQSLNTEADFRRASSALRNAAQNKVVSMFQKAVTAYKSASNEQFPTEFGQLTPYFDPPIDPAVLGRWQIVPGKTVPSIGAGDVIITQKAPVDEVFDRRLVLGSDGGQGSTDFLPPEHWAALRPVYDGYRAAHNGQWHTDYSQLQPYVMTVEQQVALEKMMLIKSASK